MQPECFALCWAVHFDPAVISDAGGLPVMHSRDGIDMAEVFLQ